MIELNRIYNEDCLVGMKRIPDKSVEVIKKCINYSALESGIILDPMSGSFTTIFAAKQYNLYSIGIEREEKYCEIAAKRCSQQVMELSC